MGKTNNIHEIIGFILVGLGIITWLMNFSLGTQVEFVTHQTYYAIKEVGSLLIVLIGAVLIK